MENIVKSIHCSLAGNQIPYIADIETYLMGNIRKLCLILVTHVVLFLLVSEEDANFFYVCCKKTSKYSIAETTGSAGNHQGFVFKD